MTRLIKRNEIVNENNTTSLCLFYFFVITFSILPFTKAEGGTMELSSPAFNDGEMIPGKYTCDGDDVSPPLKWDLIPDGSISLVLICDDPDAPVGTWVHWVYYDISANTKSLPESIIPDEHPTIGGVQGINDFRRIGYGGPCPPGGIHRYYFKLYALDTLLKLPPGATKQQVVKAMENHIIEHVQLMGKYKR